MKIYINCDIEGVAGLSSWEEARSYEGLYPPFAREMSLEAAACARGAFAAGADEVVVEDGHGDGRNIDISLLPSGSRLIRGITHDLFGVTGAFDGSYDALAMVGFHAAASSDGNPASHTIVSAHIASLHVNGQLWGEFEVSAYAAARIGVPVIFLSGDEAVCGSAEALIPGVSTVRTKSGIGYSVLSRTPEDVIAETETRMAEAVRSLSSLSVPEMPEKFEVELRYLHHYDAKNAAQYPGAKRKDSCTVCFECRDYADVLRFLYFVV